MSSKEDVKAQFNQLSEDDQRECLRDLIELGSATLHPDGGDLAVPIHRMLVNTSVIGDPKAQAEAANWRAAFSGVSNGQAAIESTATALSKWWAVLIGGGTAGGTLLATWRADAANFWSGATVAERVASLACVSALLVAALFSIAMIVVADVRSRGVASAAQYEARSAIAGAYIDGVARVEPPRKP